MLGDGRSIVLKAHKPVGESPCCVYTEETHQPPRLYFPLFSALEATVTIPALSPPLQALLSPFLPSPVSSPPSQGEDEAVAAQLGSMQLLL